MAFKCILPPPADILSSAGNSNHRFFRLFLTLLLLATGLINASAQIKASSSTSNKNTYTVPSEAPSVGATVTSVDGIVMTWGGADFTTTGVHKFATASNKSNEAGSNEINTSSNSFIKNNSDAWSEKQAVKSSSDYKHGQTTDPIHVKTFLLPVEGSFYKFEPTKNGTLTVYVEQQGAFSRSGNSVTQVLKRRPVYFLDETGTPQKATAARTTSRVNSEYWKQFAGSTAMIADDFLSAADQEKLRTYYKAILSGSATGYVDINDARSSNKNKAYTVGTTSDYQPIIELHTSGNVANELNASDLVNAYTDTNYDGTGYMLIDEGFVNYTFEVKAGKTYYLFGYRTKLGLCGFKFEQSSSQATESLTLDETKDNSNALTQANVGKQYNITLKRTLKTDIWNALVLPFSISQKQLKQTFGDGVKVLHFDHHLGKGYQESDNTMYFYKHYYEMVVAGTPLLIKPAKVNSNNEYTFTNVTLETNTISPIEVGDYTCTGTYNVKSENVMPYSAFYFSTTDGNVKQLTKQGGVAAKAFRPWIQKKSGEAPVRMPQVVTTDFEDGSTTGIFALDMESGVLRPVSDIYNLNGQKVRTAAQGSEGLPAGIYVQNGKKFMVK